MSLRPFPLRFCLPNLEIVTFANFIISRLNVDETVLFNLFIN